MNKPNSEKSKMFEELGFMFDPIMEDIAHACTHGIFDKSGMKTKIQIFREIRRLVMELDTLIKENQPIDKK